MREKSETSTKNINEEYQVFLIAVACVDVLIFEVVSEAAYKCCFQFEPFLR